MEVDWLGICEIVGDTVLALGYGMFVTQFALFVKLYC